MSSIVSSSASPMAAAGHRRTAKTSFAIWLPVGISLVAAGAAPFLGGYFLYVLTFAGVYAIISLGNNVLLGHAGLVSLGQGALMAFGAYAAGFALRAGIPWYGGIPIALVVAGGVGFLIGLPALRLSGHYLALVTLAFALATEEIIIVLQEFTGGVSGMPVAAGVASPLVNYVATVALVCMLAISQHVLLAGPFGRALHLVRDSERAAAAAGVNVAGMKLLAFTYSGVLAGIAGGLFVSATQYLTPSMFDLWLSVNVLAAVVLGGMNRPIGAVVGALFVAIVLQLSTAYQGLASIIFGTSLLLFLLFVRGATVRTLSRLLRHLARRDD